MPRGMADPGNQIAETPTWWRGQLDGTRSVVSFLHPQHLAFSAAHLNTTLVYNSAFTGAYTPAVLADAVDAILGITALQPTIAERQLLIQSLPFS
ncbi:MAG: hypothetical protein BJ554DRAFT_1564 [Olpidium bornovanus]|uniref:Uncharacterized protein n=1 Tax=Olpidium bornovanus TaxID=278681 RepID=A0A8H7ZRK8_9FUNG|nr:MAG: hypothetical protein BJ554DRAFT_1564 [Olpidium bornovanus]